MKQLQCALVFTLVGNYKQSTLPIILLVERYHSGFTDLVQERMPTLGRYLSTILDGNDKGVQFRFKQNPQLDRSRANVILVYYGSFNPPHRGHLAVLWHAYYQLAKELNIVAAVIRPFHDDRVRFKYRDSKTKTLLLPFK